MVCVLASSLSSTPSTENWSSTRTSTQWLPAEGCTGRPVSGFLVFITTATGLRRLGGEPSSHFSVRHCEPSFLRRCDQSRQKACSPNRKIGGGASTCNPSSQR